MTIVTGTVENVSTKYEKYSIQVNGEWYGTKMEYANVKPQRGDEVEFDNGGKKYTSRLKITKAGAGGSAPAGGKGGYSTLGVELGHASNLAMRMMEQTGECEEVGTTEYYKQFAKYTDEMFRIMKGLRAKYEEADKPKVVEEAPPVVMTAKAETPKPESTDDLADLF